MTAAFAQRDIQRLISEAEYRFACNEIAMCGGQDRYERRNKRKVVHQVAERFFRAMNSDKPPRTRDEAVRMALPIGWLILSIIWKTLALEIARWLWERTQGE